MMAEANELQRMTAAALSMGWRPMADAPRDAVFRFEHESIGGAITMGMPVAVLAMHPDEPESIAILDTFWSTGPRIPNGQWWDPINEEPHDLDFIAWMPLPERDAALKARLQMCFQLGKDAEFWRAFGENIPRKAEAEQAYMLTRFLKLAASAGEKWYDVYKAQWRAKLEPLEALGRALRYLGPSDEELAPFVHAAAIRWCGTKERETGNDDIVYFKANWLALPGLRSFVLAEHAKRTSQAPAALNAQES